MSTLPIPGAVVTWVEFDEYNPVQQERSRLGVVIGYDDRGQALILPLGDAADLTRRDPAQVSCLSPQAQAPAPAAPAPAPAPAPAVNVLKDTTPAVPVDVAPVAPAVVTSPVTTPAPALAAAAPAPAPAPVPSAVSPLAQMLAPAMSPTAYASVQ